MDCFWLPKLLFLFFFGAIPKIIFSLKIRLYYFIRILPPPPPPPLSPTYCVMHFCPTLLTCWLTALTTISWFHRAPFQLNPGGAKQIKYVLPIILEKVAHKAIAGKSFANIISQMLVKLRNTITELFKALFQTFEKWYDVVLFFNKRNDLFRKK